MKRSSTTSVSRFFLETLVVASNDAGLAKATIDLGRSDVGRRYVGLDPSLPIVLSCAGMRSPRRPKLRSPCCAHDEGRDYWDLATLEIQTFRPMRCSRAQARRLHTTCVLGMAWRESLKTDQNGPRQCSKRKRKCAKRNKNLDRALSRFLFRLAHFRFLFEHWRGPF